MSTTFLEANNIKIYAVHFGPKIAPKCLAPEDPLKKKFPKTFGRGLNPPPLPSKARI